jgi:enoyl-[acyl-carrier-protein] reductase (NADH)
MAINVPRPALKGARALVVGVANEHSIAWAPRTTCRARE